MLFGFPSRGVKLVEKLGVGDGVADIIIVVVRVVLRFFFRRRDVGKPLSLIS